MSYYFRFETKEIKLRKDVPKELIEFLDGYINKKLVDIPSPPHLLFRMERWSQLFGNGNYSLKAEDKTYFKFKNGYWRLLIKCCINYGREEMLEFAKWITPYVTGHTAREYIGKYQGEDSSNRYNLYIERPMDMKRRVINFPTDDSLSNPFIFYEYKRMRQLCPNAIFLYEHPFPLLNLPKLSEEQMKVHKEAMDLISKYAKDHKVTIEWAKHDPTIPDDVKKRLGL